MSLVELLVSILVIVIIFISWLRISNFQAIRKESLRREAIECAAGYLDFMSLKGYLASSGSRKFYRISFNDVTKVYSATEVTDNTTPMPYPLFGEDEPIGYVLDLVRNTGQYALGHSGAWPANGSWAVIRLYDRHSHAGGKDGLAALEDQPFSTMSVLVKP